MFYGFLSAILPDLVPGQAQEMSVAEFDALAADYMSARDFAAMTAYDPAADMKRPALYRKLVVFDAYLNWKVACARAEKLGISADYPMPENWFSEVDYALPAAAASNDPAERENALDQLRWQFIDEQIIGHDLDFEYLCAYRLKLVMLEKHLRRNQADGKTVFEQAVDTLDSTGIEI